MDLTSLTVFDQMQQKMHWLSVRQAVLSQNVANADTPGYVPSDLKPFTFGQHLELAKALPMTITNVSHVMPGGASMLPISIKDAVAVETNPAGNKVSLEDQLTKVADTGMEYQMLTNLYRKQVSMMKTAIGRGGSA